LNTHLRITAEEIVDYGRRKNYLNLEGKTPSQSVIGAISSLNKEKKFIVNENKNYIVTISKRALVCLIHELFQHENCPNCSKSVSSDEHLLNCSDKLKSSKEQIGKNKEIEEPHPEQKKIVKKKNQEKSIPKKKKVEEDEIEEVKESNETTTTPIRSRLKKKPSNIKKESKLLKESGDEEPKIQKTQTINRVKTHLKVKKVESDNESLDLNEPEEEKKKSIKSINRTRTKKLFLEDESIYFIGDERNQSKIVEKIFSEMKLLQVNESLDQEENEREYEIIEDIYFEVKKKYQKSTSKQFSLISEVEQFPQAVIIYFFEIMS
jgi:hypothetical protein